MNESPNLQELESRLSISITNSDFRAACDLLAKLVNYFPEVLSNEDTNEWIARLGRHALDDGAYDQARSILELAMTGALKPSTLSSVLANLAFVGFHKNEIHTVLKSLHGVNQLFDAHRTSDISTRRQTVLGLVYRMKGDLQAEKAVFQKKLYLAKLDRSEKVEIAALYATLGYLHHSQRDYEWAIRYCNRALDLYDFSEMPSESEVNCIRCLLYCRLVAGSATHKNSLALARRGMEVRRTQLANTKVAHQFYGVASATFYANGELNEAEGAARYFLEDQGDIHTYNARYLYTLVILGTIVSWQCRQTCKTTGNTCIYKGEQICADQESKIERFNRSGTYLLTIHTKILTISDRVMLQACASGNSSDAQHCLWQMEFYAQALLGVDPEAALLMLQKIRSLHNLVYVSIAEIEDGSKSGRELVEQATGLTVPDELPRASVEDGTWKDDGESYEGAWLWNKWTFSYRTEGGRVFEDFTPNLMGTKQRNLPNGELEATWILRGQQTAVVIRAPRRGTVTYHLKATSEDLMNRAAQLHSLGQSSGSDSPILREKATSLFWDLFDAKAGNDVLNCRSLRITPTKGLWQLPFSLLLPHAEGRFLGLTHSISVNSMAIRTGPRHDSTEGKGSPGMTVFGISDFADEEYSFLPHAETEATDVASRFDSVAHLGKQVTKARVLEGLQHGHLLHIATHCVLDRDNPVRSGMIVYSDDGKSNIVLSALDIERFGSARTDLVVISGCESGGHRLEDRESTTGLPDALARAGVRSTVVSVWPIEDRATAKFMEFFYSYYIESGKVGEALLAARQRIDGVTGSLPRHWAGFAAFSPAVS